MKVGTGPTRVSPTRGTIRNRQKGCAMRVTRVEVEGPTTSFRYPHFLVGRQPTYEMPPLATLYGHICSAVGEWLDPSGLRIGFRFTYTAKADDKEQIHIITASAPRAKLPGTDMPANVETGAPQSIQIREYLFEPRLTLYVAPAEWTEAFRQPRYTVILGRSQDLMTYTRVSEVELVEAADAYYEHTLLPWALRPHVLRCRTELLPRFVDYANRRQPHFARYLVVKERIFTNEGEHWLRYADRGPKAHWVDPESPEVRGLRRGVWLHSLLESDDGDLP
jgi:CRISPR-associated protein Cas5t